MAQASQGSHQMYLEYVVYLLLSWGCQCKLATLNYPLAEQLGLSVSQTYLTLQQFNEILK